MGLFIISGVLLIIGIAFLIVGKKSNNDIFGFTGFGLVFTFGIIVFILTCFVCAVQIPKQIKYEQALYEKQVLEYRVYSQEKNIVGNELLYSDIVEYNNKLRVVKKWNGNFMIGIYYNDLIAGIDYIDYAKLE